MSTGQPEATPQQRRVLEDAHLVYERFGRQVRLGDPAAQSRYFEHGVPTSDIVRYRKECMLTKDALQCAGLWVVRWMCRRETETDLALVNDGEKMSYGPGESTCTVSLRLEVVDCSAQDIVDADGPGAKPVAVARPLKMIESIPAHGGDIVASPYLPNMMAQVPGALAAKIQEQQVCLDWLAAMAVARPTSAF